MTEGNLFSQAYVEKFLNAFHTEQDLPSEDSGGSDLKCIGCVHFVRELMN